MNIILLDTETTDIENPRLVELAYKVYDLETRELKQTFCGLFKPPTPISFEAMSVHHITNEMVSNEEEFRDNLQRVLDFQELLRCNVLVAHNAKFDIGVLKNEGIQTYRFIDTLRCARHLIDSPNYSLQYLRYSLGLKVKEGEKGKAHNALDDVDVLDALFNHLEFVLYEKYSRLEQPENYMKMVELTNTKVKLKTLNFGKYKGEDLYHVAMKDKQYIQWLNREETKKPKEEQNEDLVYTLSFYI